MHGAAAWQGGIVFLTWLPDVLRDAGVRINVMDGAATRSTTRSGLSSVKGIVWHDTVTPKSWSNAQVRNLLRDGHSNLKGPLSQVGVERDGLWDIVALGKCSHNGYGLWGNDAIGLEFFNAGGDVREVNPPAQVESGLIGTAAILRHLDMSVTQVKGHKETDPNRKRDPWGLDMHLIRWQLLDRLNPTHESDPDLTPREFLHMAFVAALGRLPNDATEQANHEAFLAFHGREKTLANLADSAEAKARR